MEKFKEAARKEGKFVLSEILTSRYTIICTLIIAIPVAYLVATRSNVDAAKEIRAQERAEALIDEQREANRPIQQIPQKRQTGPSGIVNPSTTKVRVTFARLKLLQAFKPNGGYGANEPIDQLAFYPQHYDASKKEYRMAVTDIVWNPKDSDWLECRIVDPTNAGKYWWTELTVWFHNGIQETSLTFDQKVIPVTAK